MPCTNPCEECAQSGLPILFTRYAAYYSAVPKDMAEMARLRPTGNLQAQPGGVAIQSAIYQLRMLRPGFLYVRTEADCRTPEWQAYVVHPHGYLTEVDIEAPERRPAKASCRPNEWGANRSLVWIKDVKAIRSLHYMFYPDPIEYGHLMKVIDKAPGQYMQSFDVAAWAQGNMGQKDTCQPGLLNGQVVEFAALGSDSTRKAMEEQFFGLMGINTQERGWHEVEPFDASKPALYPQFAGPTYDDAHGKRLKGMGEYLQAKKGAVVACEDPIGIAQALGMHHTLAAMPYELWAQSALDTSLPQFQPVATAVATLAKDFPKITNGWMAAASSSVDQLLTAMKNGVIATPRAELDNLKRKRQDKVDGNSPSVRLYDSTFSRTLSPQEALGEDIRSLDGEIAAKQAEVSALEACTTDAKLCQTKVGETLEEARSLIRQPLIDAFDAVHKQQLALHDARMGAISNDAIAWLDSNSHLKALARYNGKEAAKGGDGERFALQMIRALSDLQTSHRGRTYLGAKDPFNFSRDNLTARMLSCNNAKISQELRDACKQLEDASKASVGGIYPGNGYEIMIKHAEALTKIMGGFKEIGASAEKMNALFGARHNIDWNKGAQGFADASNAARLAHAAGLQSVAFASIALFAIRLPATQREAVTLTGKGLALASGLGAKAVDKLKQEVLTLKLAQARSQAVTQHITQGTINGLLAREQNIQGQLENHVKAAAKTQGVIGTHRIRNWLLVAEALSVVSSGSAKAMRMDMRNALETSSQVLGVIGTMRDIRTMLFEEMVFKSVVPAPGQVAPFAVGTHLDKVATLELKRLKWAAARFTIPAGSIMVAFDVFDAIGNGRHEKYELSAAYAARALGGTLSLGGIFVGIAFARYARLVLCLNVAGLLITVASTIAIELLKDKEWQAWLKAQPFRDDTKAGPGAWKTSAFQSMDQMMSKFVDALTEVALKKD